MSQCLPGAERRTSPPEMGEQRVGLAVDPAAVPHAGEAVERVALRLGGHPGAVLELGEEYAAHAVCDFPGDDEIERPGAQAFGEGIKRGPVGALACVRYGERPDRRGLMAQPVEEQRLARMLLHRVAVFSFAKPRRV